MGMYDSVIVNCIDCGNQIEFQSKSGECILETFTLDTCPVKVLMGINRHSPNECDICGAKYEIDVHIKILSAKLKKIE
jgi:hypothetical protein